MTNAEQAARDGVKKLSERISKINDRVAEACDRSGRRPEEVTLIGVTKTVSPAIIRDAISAGLRIFGENRVQEASAKIAEIGSENLEWHLIGHLQSNKARKAVELFDVIQSIDGFKLAERLNSIAAEAGKTLPVFIEVNLGGEESKSGAPVNEVLPLCDRIGRLRNLSLLGLMAVPPFLDDPEELRPFFRRLRELRDEAHRAGIVSDRFNHLSMGMSGDFETAVEEGATFIRIGTAIFGARV